MIEEAKWGLDWVLRVRFDGGYRMGFTSHNLWTNNIVGDALRQNSLVISGDAVLRLPLLGLRLQPDDFFDQIGEALIARGWTAAA